MKVRMTHPPTAPSDRFWRSVGVVLTGSAMAQAIPLLGSLAIARIYAPGEFGLFASWLGVTSLLAVVITGRFEMALALEPDGEPRRVAVIAVLVTVAAASGGVLCLLTLSWLAGWARLPHTALWFLGALTAALMATAQTWQAWAAANGNYRRLSTIRIAQATLVTGSQILAGLYDPSAPTLAFAHAAGVAGGIAIAMWQLPLSLRQPSGPGWRHALRDFCARHRRLPMVSLPADSINTAAGQLPLLIVTTRFGAEVAGWLALTMRMLGGPISLLGAAVLDVFRRHAAQSWREHGQCRGDYMRAFKVLGGASALFVLALAPASEALFQLAFGAPWRMAGTIAFWLLPMFAFRFVASPLSYMFYVADKQHIDLLWQSTLLCMTLASLLLPASYSAALQIYSLGYSGMYIIYLLLSYRFSLGPAR